MWSRGREGGGGYRARDQEREIRERVFSFKELIGLQVQKLQGRLQIQKELRL